MPGYFKYSRLVLGCRKSLFCRRVLPCIILLVLSGYSCYSQRGKIDSLRNVLPSLEDSTLVDGFNLLSLAYSYLQIDSANAYARRAYSEAVKVNYQRGKVMALNNQAHIAGYAFNNFSSQEKICLETIPLAKKIYDKRVLAETYLNLALALFCQGLFERSAEACRMIINLAQETGDQRATGEALAVLGSIGFESGNYEKSFEYFNKSLEVFTASGDSYNSAIVLAKLGDLYRLSGDNKSALSFYLKSLNYPKGPSLLWYPLVDLGDTYYLPEVYDSTTYGQSEYNHAIKALTIRTNNIIVPRIRRAEMHIASRQYDQAVDLLINDLKLSRERNDKNQVMRILLGLAKAYEGKKAFTRAFYHTRDLLHNARVHNAKQYIRDGYKLMFTMHEQLKHTDSAYYFFRQYTSMKDSVAVDDFARKLSIYKAATESEKRQAEIESLNNEKLFNIQKLQLAEQQLKGESLVRNILISGVAVLFLVAFILFRNISLQQRNTAQQHEFVKQELNLQKIESDKAKIELAKQTAELEMKALRAQMNPHFIFNSLNSINRFILQSNKLQASEYLTKFSKLVRLILQNSQLAVIPLESELEALQLYLELEAVRFDDHFEYHVDVGKDLDCAAVKVPPLIIQPFVENAIWHGLMHKEEKGNLQIALFQQNNLLCCKITDDGYRKEKSR